MANATPYEVLAGSPIALYWAPVGTAFPDLDDDEVDFDALWKKIGASGDLNYEEGGGVSIEHQQNIVMFRPLGAVGPIKAFRQEENQNFKLKVIDLTLDAYRLALNNNTITTVAAAAGAKGYKSIGLSRGKQVAQMALLIRLLESPYGASWIGQYQMPKVSEIGSPTVQYMKSVPAGLELNFTSLVDTSAATEDLQFGKLMWQDANAA